MNAQKPRQRVTLNDLNEPQQVRELNRQMEWVWSQLMGGLTRKALSAGLNNVIESKAEHSEVDGLSDAVLRQSTLIEQNAASIAGKASQSSLDALGNRVSGAEASLSLVPNQISAAVNAVQVGGANLFTGTKDFSGEAWLKREYGWTVSTSTYNGCYYAYKTGAWNCMSQKVWVEAGTEYTYSMWVKCSSSQTMQYLFYRDGTTGHCTVEGGNTGTIANVGTEWQRISFTKKVATSGWAEPGIDVQNSGVTWYICGIKFEQGNKATYWTESDSDIRTYTSAQLTILDNEISSKASQTSVDALGNRVSAAESSILQTPQEISAAVTAVQVGATNLLRRADCEGKQFFKLFADTKSGYGVELPGYTPFKSGNLWGDGRFVLGETYTVSFTAKATRQVDLEFDFYPDTFGGAFQNPTVTVTTSPKRFSVSSELTNSGTPAEMDLRFFRSAGASATVQIWDIKIEKGNKATDWCEAEGEFFAGSTARMTKDGFFFAGDTWEVDLPGDENFHLDSAGGSMKNFSADTVKAKNLAEVYTGPASVTIGSSGTYKSLREFANAVNNRVVDKTVTVTLSDSNYYESVEFAGVHGGGRLWFQGAKTITGQTRFVNNTAYMRFDNTVFVGRVYMLNVSFIAFESCTFNGNGDGTGSSVQEALFLDNGSKCHANGCGIYNAASLIRVDAGSTFTSNNMKGGNCVNFILATRCSVCMQGTRPGGNRATTTVLSPNDPANLTIDYGSATPVVNPTTTTTINCKASKTAYDATHWHGDNRIRQGYYDMGSSGMNEQYGCFWFDTSALSGKTVKSALLTLTRIAGYGRSSEVSVRLYTTPLTGDSGNPLTSSVDQGVLGTIGNGETKQFTIPTAAISASANKGFMLRVDDGALISGRGYSDNYAHFYGYGESDPPVLTVTYQ